MAELTRRQQYDQRQRRRSIAAAAASSVVAVVALVVLVPRLSGWESVRSSFFDGDVLATTFPKLLRAFLLDLKILAWTAPAVLVLSVLVALARGARSPVLFPLRAVGVVFTDVFRGVPTILVITLIGFGVPAAFGLRRPWNDPVLWGSVALTLSYAAYVAEIIRSGIEGVHESQRAAARSIGMTSGQTMRSIVLPQAFRSTVPPMMNSFVSLQKDVALVSVLGPVEVLRRAEIEQSRFFNFTPYVGAAIIFLSLTIPLTRLADYLLARQQRRTGGTQIT
ncbi:MAG TPA: amino acid ABC transporter permease [Ilumatobacter sp.]|nr:amino acid ABC transporter permease [Ilumatobacter sp.]